MSTKFRPDISKKNKYWISKHRYYELKHFCLQYNEWKQKLNGLSYVSSCDIVDGTCKDGMKHEQISNKAYILSRVKSKIDLVESCCNEAAEDLSLYLLMSVTEGKSYENLRMVYEIPCSRQSFYACYRKFFFILSQKLQSL